jgi:hypothetical protein
MRRGACLALAVVLLPLAQAALACTTSLRADLTQPTDRYDHAVLGDALEWGGLRLTLSDPRQVIDITLPEARVFEDIETRVDDFNGDGCLEVMVVESDAELGGSLALYNETGKIAATPFIGQTHRWLAPAGWGDFDGDGQTEIAYVDRPHLARELVFVRFDGTRLTEIARIPGLTNHRIGESTISGGTRRCAGGDSLILASADWSRIIEVTLAPDGPQTRDLGPRRSNADLTRAQRCS